MRRQRHRIDGTNYRCAVNGQAHPTWTADDPYLPLRAAGSRYHRGAAGYLSVAKDLMARIQRELLDERPLDSILRKLILVGGDAGSSELQEWAAAELRGYKSDELPDYRTVFAPLQIDGVIPGGSVRHQTIGSLELPDFARDSISERVPLKMGVSEIQSMVKHHGEGKVVKLSPPGAADLVAYMNGTQRRNGHIVDLYWSVSIVALEGVLDQIRTRLAELIAQLRSRTPNGQQLPSGAQADNAVNLVIHGRGHRVNISQAASGGTIHQVPEPELRKPRFWTLARIIGAVVVGAAGVVGAVFAVLQYTLPPS